MFLEVDHVIEQRVTTIGVSILIGLIAFCGSYLRIPLASLFGVFLYLGVMNLAGVQLVQRIMLFLIPKKYFPETPYTEKVCFCFILLQNFYFEFLFKWLKILTYNLEVKSYIYN